MNTEFQEEKRLGSSEFYIAKMELGGRDSTVK